MRRAQWKFCDGIDDRVARNRHQRVRGSARERRGPRLRRAAARRLPRSRVLLFGRPRCACRSGRRDHGRGARILRVARSGTTRARDRALAALPRLHDARRRANQRRQRLARATRHRARRAGRGATTRGSGVAPLARTESMAARATADAAGGARVDARDGSTSGSRSCVRWRSASVSRSITSTPPCCRAAIRT